MSNINCILSKIQKTTLSGQQLFEKGRGHDQKKNISVPPCSLCFRKFTFYIIIIGLLLVKNSLPMQETEEMQVQSLGREDPLEEGMTTYSSIHAWRIPWTEEPGGLWSLGLQRVRLQRVRQDWSNLATHTRTHCDLIWGTSQKIFLNERKWNLSLTASAFKLLYHQGTCLLSFLSGLLIWEVDKEGQNPFGI